MFLLYILILKWWRINQDQTHWSLKQVKSRKCCVPLGFGKIYYHLFLDFTIIFLHCIINIQPILLYFSPRNICTFLPLGENLYFGRFWLSRKWGKVMVFLVIYLYFWTHKFSLLTTKRAVEVILALIIIIRFF